MFHPNGPQGGRPPRSQEWHLSRPPYGPHRLSQHLKSRRSWTFGLARNWTARSFHAKLHPMLARNLQTHAYDRILDPMARCLGPEAARSMAGFRLDAATRRRIDPLAAKCNEGLLTPRERTEYEALVAAGTMVSILLAKARRLVDVRAI